MAIVWRPGGVHIFVNERPRTRLQRRTLAISNRLIGQGQDMRLHCHFSGKRACRCGGSPSCRPHSGPPARITLFCRLDSSFETEFAATCSSMERVVRIGPFGIAGAAAGSPGIQADLPSRASRRASRKPRPLHSAMRRSCLPSLRPSNRRRSAAGAFSRPRCTSTLFLILPACTQPASAPIASEARGR